MRAGDARALCVDLLDRGRGASSGIGGPKRDSSSDEDPLFHSWRSEDFVLIEDSLFLRIGTAGTAWIAD